MKKWYQQTDIMVGLSVVAVVMMLIVPLPSFLLDLLIGVSIMLGLVALLTVMYNQENTDFHVFPSLLLISTVFRLALNVSSTRLILLEGSSFDGKLIKAFGEFVVGGNYIIGFIIFLILIFVQMMVITKGATRISEVAARFTLDALPGKQMSIDSDLSSGLITEEEAREKRESLRKEVDFYGQMDGATKFVQGDVRVGLIITGINIIGGLIIGIGLQGQSFEQAIRIYTLLTVGDGLVSQIPSLLITTATGMVVTRSSSVQNVGADISDQLFKNAKVLWIVAGTLFLSSLLPGFPKISLWFTSFLLGFVAYNITRNQNKQEDLKQSHDASSESNTTDRFFDELSIDPMKLEIGYNLISQVDPKQGGTLLDKITSLRQRFAREMGIIVPPIRIHDNMELEANDYSILINGIEVAKAYIDPDKLVALKKGENLEPIEGTPYKDPTFQVDAVLIPPEKSKEAEEKGYLVVDGNNIIITHLSEMIRNFSTQIMSREEIKLLLDKTKEKFPSVVDDVQKNLSMNTIQQVLHNLLKEDVSIKNIIVILETLLDNSERIKDSAKLTDLVRIKLSRQLVTPYISNNSLQYIQIDPNIEQEFFKHLTYDEKEGKTFLLPPAIQTSIRDALIQAFNNTQKNKLLPLYISSSEIRIGIFTLLERELPPRSFVVLAYEEIPRNIKLEPIEQAFMQSNVEEESILL